MSRTRSISAAGTPQVSVIMTVWNAEKYLAEAIESVLAQQADVTWELIIVDDGSTDSSFDIACAYARRRGNRVRLLSHRGRANLGISASRNLAIQAASADILGFLDADDVWLPHRLAGHFDLLQSCPRAAMIYGQAERWYDFDQPLGAGKNSFVPPLIPAGASAGLIDPPTLLEWFLADESMTPCTCAVLVRTAIARGLQGFETSFKGLYDDQAFYAKLALAEPVLIDLDCVARYRQHSDSCCARARARSSGSDSRSIFLDWLTGYKLDLRRARYVADPTNMGPEHSRFFEKSNNPSSP